MCQMFCVPVSDPLQHHHTLLVAAWLAATADPQESAQNEDTLYCNFTIQWP